MYDYDSAYYCNGWCFTIIKINSQVVDVWFVICNFLMEH